MILNLKHARFLLDKDAIVIYANSILVYVIADNLFCFTLFSEILAYIATLEIRVEIKVMMMIKGLDMGQITTVRRLQS